MKGLTDIAGIRVGHASDYDALTGCTVIVCETGAVAGYDIRGSATGTQEFEAMNPLHVTETIHAVVFAGGSAFGLEAASGVRRYLEQKGIGFDTGIAKVPLVPGAILFDLAIGKAGVRPTREMGESAAAAASTDPVKEGAVGAGTGATVGKMFGMSRAMKGGVGCATVALEGPLAGVLVSALAVVNALGDVMDPETGKLIAGARVSADSRELAGSAKAMKSGAIWRFSERQHDAGCCRHKRAAEQGRRDEASPDGERRNGARNCSGLDNVGRRSGNRAFCRGQACQYEQPGGCCGGSGGASDCARGTDGTNTGRRSGPEGLAPDPDTGFSQLDFVRTHGTVHRLLGAAALTLALAGRPG